MEDELRLSLLIAGTCFIVAVLAHGIWKIRKANRPASQDREEPQAWDHSDQDSDGDASVETDDILDDWQDDFDELGLGQVRVVKGASKASASAQSDDTDDDDLAEDTSVHTESSDNAHQFDSGQRDTSSKKPEKLYGSVVSNPKPHIKPPYTPPEEAEVVDFPEPPEFLLRENESADAGSDAADQPDPEVDNFSLDTQPGQPKSAPAAPQESGKPSRRRSRSAVTKRRQEPSFGDDQMRIDFDEQDAGPSFSAKDSVGEAAEQAPPEQEVLVLNVRASEDDPISGAALLPLLLTLGFKFGDQDIFHRHVNSNGKGPVLFSLANMFKPGNFDIDNLENFSTRGVSLFMILPIEGDPHQVFNMMHNAARKIADEFGAQVLDGRRSVLTRQGLQQYAEKIREFERKRIIARH